MPKDLSGDRLKIIADDKHWTGSPFVQELALEVLRLRAMYKECKEYFDIESGDNEVLMGQNQRFREALEFHAEPDNYKTPSGNCRFSERSPVQLNEGQRARVALKPPPEPKEKKSNDS